MLAEPVQYEAHVDAQSAHEFLKEATRLATSEELADIGRRQQRKSRMFREWLDQGAPEQMSEDQFKSLTGAMFGLRRKASIVLRENRIDLLRREFALLLAEGPPVGMRLQRFVEEMRGLDPMQSVALAAELLHYTRPERYWLCTRWMWDPKTRAGALPLVLEDTEGLAGSTAGETYENVGRALESLNERGHAEGFTDMAPGLFGTHVFLACVYTVYMYTAFRMKLSKEFNRILPELPELVRRMLGVNRMEAP